LPARITSYENGTIVEQTDYTYTFVKSQRVDAFRWDRNFFHSFSYNYHITWIQKDKEIVRRKFPNQDLELIFNKQFTYNNHFQLLSSNLTLDTNESQEQIIYYPTDFTDNINRAMVNAHMTGIPVETIGLRDGQVVFGKKTTYKQVYNMFLPDIIVYTLDTDVARTKSNYSSYYNPKLYFDIYNNYGKISQVRDNGISIVYLWSYNSQYPVAEIKNATYADAEAAAKTVFGVASANALSTLATPNEAKLKDGSLQRALPNALVTTYTYKPLVGMLTATDPSGATVFYEYDSFGRLKWTKDTDGNIIQEYNYHYRGQ
jgi:YD repeat-containing protein